MFGFKINALELGIGLETTQKEYYFYAIEIGPT